MGDFVCLALEMAIQLFFFLFLFSGFCYSVDACVVCIVSRQCGLPRFTLQEPH